MTEIIKPTRGKVGYIETRRRDNGGRVVKARDHVVVSKGMFSTKELEREMVEVAKSVGADESQIRIEAYQDGKAPMEANPRHRGLGNDYQRHPSSAPRAKESRESRPRKYWGGWSPS